MAFEERIINEETELEEEASYEAFSEDEKTGKKKKMHGIKLEKHDRLALFLSAFLTLFLPAVLAILALVGIAYLLSGVPFA